MIIAACIVGYVLIGCIAARLHFDHAMRRAIAESESSYMSKRHKSGFDSVFSFLLWPIFVVGGLVVGIGYVLWWGPHRFITGGVTKRRKLYLNGESINKEKVA